MAHLTPTDDPANLGDKIRKDAPLFIDASVQAFRGLITKEYLRMRGYAHEIGSPQMTLRVAVQCTFDGDGRGVIVETCPEFRPEPMQSAVAVPLP